MPDEETIQIEELESAIEEKKKELEKLKMEN
jgi:hypothetical protein